MRDGDSIQGAFRVFQKRFHGVSGTLKRDSGCLKCVSHLEHRTPAGPGTVDKARGQRLEDVQ